MSRDAIRDTVIAHALESKKSLEVACLIRAHFEDVYKKAISPFLQQLQNDLSTSLGSGWTLQNSLIRDPKGELCVFKAGWADPADLSRTRCAVVLSQKGESGYYVGWRKYAPLAPQFSEALEHELQLKLKGVGYTDVKYANDWGLWWMVKRYSKWDQNAPQVLWDMYDHCGDAVSYFKDAIRKWSDTIAPAVDEALLEG